jgi:chemotaxis protein MotB
MVTRVALLATVGLALCLGTGCAGKTADQRDSLAKQNADMAARLEASEKARLDAEERLRMQSNAVPTTPAAGDMTPSDTTSGGTVAGGTSTPTDLGEGIRITKTKGGLDVIQIPGDVLFDSGKATLKPASMKSLDKVAATIKKQYSSQTLRIEGHTDPNPVRRSGWDDNYDLGAARARAVLLYLVKKGVPEKHMYIASFGANDLKSTKNLALNRRVEIVVAPPGR